MGRPLSVHHLEINTLPAVCMRVAGFVSDSVAARCHPWSW